MTMDAEKNKKIVKVINKGAPKTLKKFACMSVFVTIIEVPNKAKKKTPILLINSPFIILFIFILQIYNFKTTNT